MATALFRPRCAHAEPNLTVVKGLAQEFQTTLTATAVRFVEACRAACLVVFSEQGGCGGGAKGATVREVWLEPAQALHCESLAWACVQGQTPPSTMQRVPTEVWFPTRRREDHVEVYEQSIQLGRYPTILSLLWIIEGAPHAHQGARGCGPCGACRLAHEDGQGPFPGACGWRPRSSMAHLQLCHAVPSTGTV